MRARSGIPINLREDLGVTATGFEQLLSEPNLPESEHSLLDFVLSRLIYGGVQFILLASRPI
jgi:hypothetical protein